MSCEWPGGRSRFFAKGMQMKKFTLAVHSLGNIGTRVVEAALAAPDCQCLGVIRRAESLGTQSHALRGLPEFTDLASLEAAQGRPDVIALCGPSRSIPETAEAFLKQGYNCVDSFDIHTEIPATVARLDAAAKAGNSVSITAAGWDPGTDSVLRALFEAMVPRGTTFTNFGRGRSMGHSVAARAIKGVADAVSITIPVGGGRHSRLVYVVLEEGENLADVTARIKADDYFAHDPLDVRLDVTKRTTQQLVREFLQLKAARNEQYGNDYGRGVLECALGIVNRDEKFQGITDFCLWYHDLLKKEGHIL